MKQIIKTSTGQCKEISKQKAEYLFKLFYDKLPDSNYTSGIYDDCIMEQLAKDFSLIVINEMLKYRLDNFRMGIVDLNFWSDVKIETYKL